MLLFVHFEKLNFSDFRGPLNLLGPSKNTQLLNSWTLSMHQKTRPWIYLFRNIVLYLKSNICPQRRGLNSDNCIFLWISKKCCLCTSKLAAEEASRPLLAQWFTFIAQLQTQILSSPFTHMLCLKIPMAENSKKIYTFYREFLSIRHNEYTFREVPCVLSWQNMSMVVNIEDRWIFMWRLVNCSHIFLLQ